MNIHDLVQPLTRTRLGRNPEIRNFLLKSRWPAQCRWTRRDSSVIIHLALCLPGLENPPLSYIIDNPLRITHSLRLLCPTIRGSLPACHIPPCQTTSPIQHPAASAPTMAQSRVPGIFGISHSTFHPQCTLREASHIAVRARSTTLSAEVQHISKIRSGNWESVLDRSQRMSNVHAQHGMDR